MRAFRLLSFLLVVASLAAQSGRVQELAQRAQSAMAASRYSEAAALYRDLVEQMPGEPGPRFNYGFALESAGNYADAIVQLERVVHESPGFTNAWLVLGLAHAKRAEPELAIEPFQRVLKAQPENRIARFELADALFSSGRLKEAAAEFGALTRQDPKSTKGWQGLYSTFDAIASSSAERLKAEAAAGSPFRIALAAQSRLEQGRMDEARSFFASAVAGKPEIAIAFPELAMAAGVNPPSDCGVSSLACSFQAGAFTRVLDATAPRGPAESLFWRSVATRALAGSALKHLSELPESAELHEVLGERYRVAGRKDDSVKEWRAAVRLAPHDSFALHGLAKALWLHRDYTEARPLLTRLLSASPQSAELNFELGDLLLEVKEVDQCLPLLERAVKISPDLLAARGALGRALLLQGDARRAIPELQAALPTDEDGSLHYQLGRAYQQTGDTAKAKQCFEEQQRIAAGTQP